MLTPMEPITLYQKFGDKFLKFLKTLDRIPPFYRWGAFFFFIGLSCYGFYHWNAVREDMLRATTAALEGRVEPTAQTYKGLESLVLACTPVGPVETKITDEPKMTDESLRWFESIVSGLQNARKEAFPLRLLGVEPHGVDGPAKQFLTVSQGKSLDRASNNEANLHDLVHAFVFVPDVSIRGGAVQFEGQVLKGHTPKSNDEVLGSLAAIYSVWRQVAELTGKPLFKARAEAIVQSYFLLRSGVLIIHQAGLPESEEQENYVSQFTGQTFLPDRPYFWRAVEKRWVRAKSGRPRTDSEPDYTTEPYIDLGTNGPIRTYCWGFLADEDPGAGEGVLCTDVKLTNAEATIRRNVSALHANVRDVYCDLRSNSCNYGTTSGWEPAKELTEAAQTRIDNQLEVFGSIFLVSETPLRFTVPLNTIMINGRRTLHLLECAIALRELQASNHWWLVSSLAILGFAITLSVSLAMLHYNRHRQLEQAINSIDYVMQHAAAPYAMVNPDDFIERANNAFQRLSVDEIIVNQLHKKTLKMKELLEWESIPDYERQTAMRKEDEPSTYEVTFKNGGKCLVYGAPIPVPREIRNADPWTFAIFVQERSAPYDTGTDAQERRPGKRIKTPGGGNGSTNSSQDGRKE